MAHGHRRVLEQVLGLAVHCRAEHDADVHAGLDLMRAKQERGAHGVEDAPGHLHCLAWGVEFVQDDHEGVAVVARDRVDAADHGGDAAGRLHEKVVAEHVPQAFVDLGVAIQLDHEHGIVVVVPPFGALQDAVNAVEAQGTVGQAREWVVQGRVLELLLHGLAHRDFVHAGADAQIGAVGVEHGPADLAEPILLPGGVDEAEIQRTGNPDAGLVHMRVPGAEVLWVDQSAHRRQATGEKMLGWVAADAPA